MGDKYVKIEDGKEVVYEQEFLRDRRIGEVRETLSGDKVIVDNWGSTVGSVERENFYGESKAEIEGDSGTISRDNYTDDYKGLRGKPVFKKNQESDNSTSDEDDDSDSSSSYDYDSSSSSISSSYSGSSSSSSNSDGSGLGALVLMGLVGLGLWGIISSKQVESQRENTVSYVQGQSLNYVDIKPQKEEPNPIREWTDRLGRTCGEYRTDSGSHFECSKSTIPAPVEYSRNTNAKTNDDAPVDEQVLFNRFQSRGGTNKGGWLADFYNSPEFKENQEKKRRRFNKMVDEGMKKTKKSFDKGLEEAFKGH